MAGVASRCPGIWSLIWSLKMSILIRRSTGDLDVLLIGVFLDTGAVGLYHIAKRFGDATLKVGVPIQQVLFPDIARLWARREIKRLRSTVAQIDLITGILAAAMLAGVGLNVDLVLGLTVGPDHADAATLVILQLLATTTALFGTALQPALLSMGLQVVLLRTVIVATLASTPRCGWRCRFSAWSARASPTSCPTRCGWSARSPCSDDGSGTRSRSPRARGWPGRRAEQPSLASSMPAQSLLGALPVWALVPDRALHGALTSRVPSRAR